MRRSTLRLSLWSSSTMMASYGSGLTRGHDLSNQHAVGHQDEPLSRSGRRS